MGVFEQFPYANMHEMNLDWLLKKMKELAQAMETFKATESLKFADPIIWDITTQYEKSTIVLDPTGNAYLSIQAVPAGVQLNNDEYWLEIFNFTDYTRTANQNLTVNTETNTTRASAPYQVDDWLIWNDVLYKVTAAIAIDDALIVAPAAGSNIVHFTVEDFCKAWIATIQGMFDTFSGNVLNTVSTYYNQTQAQINQIIAGATVDSEVINARVGFDGVTYATLGEAIRTQISNAYFQTRNAALPIMWINYRLTVSTGRIANTYDATRLLSNFIPLKQINYIKLPSDDVNLNYRLYIFRYSSNGYEGYLTGINGNVYTWGTSGAVTVNEMDFTEMQKQYPDDVLRFQLRVDDVTLGTSINISPDIVSNFIITMNLNDVLDLSVNWENGRIDTTTGLNRDDLTSETRLRSPYYKISDLVNVATDNTLYYGLFIYDENKTFVGIVNNEITLTTATGGGVIVWRENFSFDLLNAKYPNYYCRLLSRKADATALTPEDFTGYTVFRSKIIMPHDILDHETINNLILARLSDSFTSIAYSRVGSINDAPINTAEHYKKCALYNDGMFNSIKGDIRCTADGYAIMCHDPGFTFDGDGRIIAYNANNNTPIYSLTYAQCMALEYATQYEGAYCKVCDFDTYLKICKRYGKIAYTTIRDQYIAEQLENMMDCVKKYDMEYSIIFNSFTLASLTIVNANNPNLMLSLIVRNEDLTASVISSVMNFKYKMITLFDFGGATTGFEALDGYKNAGLLDMCANHKIPIFESIMYIPTLGITYDECLDQLLDYGVTGAQIGSL